MRLWQTIRSVALARHHHDGAYAAVVLSGGYEEAGDNGRLRVGPGDVVFHDRFEAHLNRFSASGAEVLNLRLSATPLFLPSVACLADPVGIVRAAEASHAVAADLLLVLAKVPRAKAACADWPDELAAALIQQPSLCLSRWSAGRGLAPWTVSRGFGQVFGISPEAFRARSRARQAWKASETTEEPLAGIAARLGFADQAHMTRSVKQLTGMPPQACRRAANGFKTG